MARRKYERWARVMSEVEFVKCHLPSGASFDDYRQKRARLRRGTVLNGERGLVWVAPKAEIQEFMGRPARDLADALGREWATCNEMLVIIFKALPGWSSPRLSGNFI